MRSVLALRAGIRVNPAETKWKRPLRHIAQFLMRNVGLTLLMFIHNGSIPDDEKNNNTMCYFIEINLTKIELEKRFGARMPEDFQWKPVFFLSGFDFPRLPVVVSSRSEFLVAHWGLIPLWVREESKALEMRSKTLNARMESICEKPSFKKPFQNHRCLIPAHGFYEWHHAGARKYPFYITLANNEPFAFAGIADEWLDPVTKIKISTFSLITTQANNLLKKIHNTKKRMPVILSPENESKWIDPSLSVESAFQFLQPYPPELLKAWPVSRQVASRTSDPYSPELIQPVSYPELQIDLS